MMTGRWAQLSGLSLYNFLITTRLTSLTPPQWWGLLVSTDERTVMRVNEIKGQLDFFTDALFQAGYDMGWNSVLEELDQLADREWNNGLPASAEVIRSAVNHMREGISENFTR
jgi:hypothetical protein